MSRYYNDFYDLDSTDFLVHYGVRGMKWGVRKDKYVNEDGSLTPKGYKHYSKQVNKQAKKDYRSTRSLATGISSAVAVGVTTAVHNKNKTGSIMGNDAFDTVRRVAVAGKRGAVAGAISGSVHSKRATDTEHVGRNICRDVLDTVGETTLVTMRNYRSLRARDKVGDILKGISENEKLKWLM